MRHMKTEVGRKGVRFVVYVNGAERDRQNIPYEDIAAGTKNFASRLIKNGVFTAEDYTTIYRTMFGWGVPGNAVRSYYKTIYTDKARHVEIKAIAFVWRSRVK